jgi:hypothetical protein
MSTPKNRLMRKDPGPGGKRTRSQRTSNVPVDDDEQTLIEAELVSSGRSDMAPREGLIGAHRVRREAMHATTDEDSGHPRWEEPLGMGADVGPTAEAEMHERERHRLQREVGVVPAGEDGNLRQLRSPAATRESLDAAARRADHPFK